MVFVRVNAVNMIHDVITTANLFPAKLVFDGARNI